MNHVSSVMRKASARLEALEQRNLFSGEIDHSFGSNGLVNLRDASGAAIVADANVTQADGKLIVAGHFYKKSETAVVARYNTNGTIDKTFGTNGFATVANAKGYAIDEVVVLSSGKIAVGGQMFLRFTSAGKLDTSFSGDGIQASYYAGNKRLGTAILADGSYLELSKITEDGHARVIKFKADGSRDSGYGTNGAFDVASVKGVNVGAVVVDASGRAYLSIQTGDLNGGSWINVIRLTAAGKLDTTYGHNGVGGETSEDYQTYGALNDNLFLLRDGRVVVGDESYSEHYHNSGLTVFAADGKKFVGGIYYGGFEANSLAQAADGTLYVAGSYIDGDDPEGGFYGESTAAVLHLKSNFDYDEKFSPDGDGIAGFRLIGKKTAANTLITLTKTGDIALIGGTNSSAGQQSDLVHVSRAGTANRLTAVFANNKLTINGSGGADHVKAFTAGFWNEPNANDQYVDRHIIRLDDDGVLASQDHLKFYRDAYDPALNLKQFVFNGNDGNDVFDARALDIAVSVRGGSGNDTIYGTKLKDSLYGDSGTDTIVGNGGGDVIVS